MSNLSVSGRIQSILKLESGVSKSGKEWKKREFVVETEDQFPKTVCLTLFGDKLNLIDGYKMGDAVQVDFNLESREFNGRWFHSINAWKISGEPSTENSYTPEPDAEVGNNSPDDGDSDLPF